jgi:hypothetical protein
MPASLHPARVVARIALLSALLGGMTERFATARQTQCLDAHWRFHLNEVDGNSAVAPPGLPLTQWVWIADNNATNDAVTMAAPGLDTATWTNVTVGTDVFNGRVGYAWFRTILLASQLPYRPAAIYFGNVDDNAWVYLNGVLIGQHFGWGQPFTVSLLNPAWIAGGTNVLAVAVQNTGGPGGIYAPVLLQSAAPQIQPPGIPVTQWIWQADSNAPNDWATMTATNLDTSAWQPAAIGQARRGFARHSMDWRPRIVRSRCIFSLWRTPALFISTAFCSVSTLAARSHSIWRFPTPRGPPRGRTSWRWR